MSAELSVIAGGLLLGHVRHAGNGRMSFFYDAAWRDSTAAYPLSLSMPLTAAEHPHRAIDPFLRGLLPDNPGVLEEWGKRFQVSPRNVFKILWHVGEDCAGAVQFVPREREGELLGPAPEGHIDWLSEADLEERIIHLLDNHGSTRSSGDRGQFSLAGAQPKTALYRDPQGGPWGLPSGSTPTTHILKPTAGRFAGHAENEHFCLMLAHRLGLRVPDSTVIHPAGRPVIVVTRYDRVFRQGRCLRVHQEDLCQALGIAPGQKYENEGGPTAKSIASLLRGASSDPAADLRQLAAALAFNWLIAGTDAHAKNYSVLIAARRQVRLAPFYDLASALPYPQDIDPYRAKLAMKIGSEYLIRKITRRHWEACAAGLGIPAKEMLEIVESIAERLPGLAVETAQALHGEGVEHPVIGVLVDALEKHVGECRERLVG